MPDNLNSPLLVSRQERQRAQMDALLAEADQLMAQGATPRQAPPPVAPASPKPSSPGVLPEAFKAVGGGVLDAGRNTINAIDDAATWLDNNFLDLRIGSSTFGQWGGAKATGNVHKEQFQVPALPDYLQNKTAGGQAVRSVFQFVTPFLGAVKGLRYAAPVMGRAGAAVESSAAVRGAAAGAATDFAAFDPHEKRLSNLLVDLGDSAPALKNPITEYLAAAPGDSAAEGRLKNTIEGLGVGLAVEGLFKGLRATKEHFSARGHNPVEAVQAAHQEHLKDLEVAPVDTAKAPDLSLQKQIELLTGADRANPGAAKWQKRLDVTAAVRSEATSPEESLKAAENAVLEKRPFRPLVDNTDGAIVLTREDPTPTQLDLGDRVKAAMFKAPHERTAEDFITLRAYQKLQEAAFPGLIKPADEMAQAEGRSLVVEPPVGSGKAAFSDAERASLLDPQGATIKPSPAALELDQRISAAQSKVDALLAEGKAPGSAQVVLDGLLKKRDAALRDHSSALSAKQADSMALGDDTLMAAIRSNQQAIDSATMRNQGGFISPAVLTNMVTAQAGGLVGWNSAEDDASLAEKLSLAGMGALTAMGVKVGASKVLTQAERAVIEKAPAEVRSLARKEVANIAPRMADTKPLPVITRAKVEKLVEAAKTGDFQNLAKAAKEADFNFDRIDTSDEVKAMIESFSSVFEKETALAKHGTQSFAQIKDLAEELGSGVGSLKELYQGTENLGARVLAHRALLTASAEKVTQLSRLAVTGDSDGILALRKQVALHASIQAQMKGVQTEVARALAQFRIQSASVDLAINERNQLIEAMGGHAANIKFAQQLTDITDPKKLHAVVRKGAMARTSDALYEAWVNGLLSAPTTHAVNMVGNSLVAIGSAAERGAAAMIGKVLRPAEQLVDRFAGTNLGAGRGVDVSRGEVKAYLYGMTEGLVDALRITSHGLDTLKQSAGEAMHGNFGAAERLVRENVNEFGGAWKAFATDAPVLDNAAYGTREFDLQSAAISADRLGLSGGSFLAQAADGMGALVRTPGRLLTTSDELFKTIHYRGELKAQAYRNAMAEGLEGDNLFQRVAALVEDPTPEMRAQALNAARQGTFTSPLGKGMSHFQQWVMNTPGMRYIAPFVRTPTNIISYVGVRTPGLNLLSSAVREELSAGGARRDMMLAKTSLGGTLYALGAYLAAQGVIVGGGEKDQSAERLGGKQPYSVKIGDTYYAFNRMDPFGMFLGLAADFSAVSGHMGSQESGDLASTLVTAISRNLTSKSYISGLVKALAALADPEAQGANWVEHLAGSIVPAAVNSIRKEDDPTVKEVWSVMDAIKSRIPGLSKDVPPMLNLFGEEVVYKGGLGPDIASPVFTSQESTDPAAAEIARLNLDIRHPPRMIGASQGTPGVHLDPQQYHRLMKLIGNEAKSPDGKGFKDALLDLIQSPEYRALPEDPSNALYPEAKERTIRVLYEGYRRLAVATLLEEDEALKAKFIQNLQNAGNALMGGPVIPF